MSQQLTHDFAGALERLETDHDLGSFLSVFGAGGKVARFATYYDTAAFVQPSAQPGPARD